MTVGGQRALVVFGSPRLSSEVVDGSGQVSAQTTAFGGRVFEAPSPGESGPVAGGGGTVAVTWWSGSAFHPTPIYAMRWRAGRWSKPTALAVPTRGAYPANPIAAVNSRGEASVVWYVTSHSSELDNYTQAAFYP